MEIKKNLTIARGEWGGEGRGGEGSGEGFLGTTIKDTWTKSGGGGRWVWLGGVEGWGENADNCN